jgi:hypothetical protein
MKAPAVNFRDVAATAGLSAVVVSGDLDQTFVVENTGTGVAIFDYDNDGLPDIFLVQGDRLNQVQCPSRRISITISAAFALRTSLRKPASATSDGAGCVRRRRG